jgi:DNA repair photolyase
MSLIYEPARRAREYAALACNVYRGCDHNCAYCYSPLVLHMRREEFALPTKRKRDFLKQLEREAANLSPANPVVLLAQLQTALASEYHIWQCTRL